MSGDSPGIGPDECKFCGQPVSHVGGPVLEPELQRVVHEATGSERGPDGHLAIPRPRVAARTPGAPFGTAGFWPA